MSWTEKEIMGDFSQDVVVYSSSSKLGTGPPLEGHNKTVDFLGVKEKQYYRELWLYCKPDSH